MTKDPLVTLIQKLCQLDASTGKEKKSVDFLQDYLSKLGWKTERQPIGPEMGRDNLWAFSKDRNPKVIFSTHLDTVPPFFPPHLSENGKTLLGRGVCDAKGIGACMVFAAEELRKRKEQVGLLFVVGEETVSDGAKKAALYGVKAKYIVVGEPTEHHLIQAMKGIASFELKATGISAHSAYPHLGTSALHQLIEDIHTLLHFSWPKDPVLGETTCNIGLIQGGRAPNVIADVASAKGTIRTVVKTEEILQSIRSCIHPTTQLIPLNLSDPQYLKIIDGIKTGIVSFGSDVPHLRPIGEPLLLGPGSILFAHTDNEKIDIEDLHLAVDLYIQVGLKLLNREC